VVCGAAACGVAGLRKRFFFEKKNQNTFPGLVCAADARLGTKGKSFLVLFFKKAPLPSLALNFSGSP
jgi:hypothetical protein